MAILMSGKKVAEKILKPVEEEILNLKQKGIAPTLAIILVDKDPQSLVYIKEKIKKAKQIGAKIKLYKFKKDIKTNQLKELIKKLNQDPKVHGILVQLPLPSRFDTDEILKLIDPQKDVDGLTLDSPYPPACASGIMEILAFYGLKVKDKKVVILGKGRTVGKPLYRLMRKEKARVILCDSKTKDKKSKTLSADILVGATPIEDFISKEMVKKGVVVIDAAKNIKKDVAKVASYLTPKIKGVGPVTIAELFKNLVEATKRLGGLTKF